MKNNLIYNNILDKKDLQKKSGDVGLCAPQRKAVMEQVDLSED